MTQFMASSLRNSPGSVPFELTSHSDPMGSAAPSPALGIAVGHQRCSVVLSRMDASFPLPPPLPSPLHLLSLSLFLKS